MAGRRRRGNGRRRNGSGGSENTSRRKPAVAPIIDLEATVVDDAEAERSAEAPAGGAGDTQKDEPRAEAPPATWMDEMKTFFLGGLHIGRLRIPVAGSLLVGAIFLGGIWLGSAVGPDRTRDTANTAAMTAALEKAAAQINDMSARFDALDAKVDTVSKHALNAQSAADAALSEVRALDAGLQDTVRAPDENQAGALETLQEQITGLASRLEQLTRNVSSIDGAAISQALEQKIAELSKAFADLKAYVEDAARSAPAPDAAQIEETVQATKQELIDMLTRIEQGLDEKLKELDGRISAGVQTEPAKASVAAARLQRAVDAGRAYQGELATLSTMMPGDPAVTGLAEHAATGVATRAALSERFDTLAADLTADPAATDQTAEDGEGGLISDVWSRVNTLVDVRKSSEPGSRALRTAVETAKVHLENGDLGYAAEALSAAGADMPEAAAKWIQDARARDAVDAAMDGLLRRAIAITGEPTVPSDS